MRRSIRSRVTASETTKCAALIARALIYAKAGEEEKAARYLSLASAEEEAFDKVTNEMASSLNRLERRSSIHASQDYDDDEEDDDDEEEMEEDDDDEEEMEEDDDDEEEIDASARRYGGDRKVVDVPASLAALAGKLSRSRY